MREEHLSGALPWQEELCYSFPESRDAGFTDGKSSGNYFLGEFGIDETLCSKLLAKALSRGGDFADLYFEYTVSNYLGLEDGKVNQSYGDISLGVGIRPSWETRSDTGYTQELTEESMMSAAATAASLCDMTATRAAVIIQPASGRELIILLPAGFDGIPAAGKTAGSAADQ
ncbi:MAG: hypothetical protein MZV63_50080 [Marinilabiliales bacterium]|nr:hypothetical protein [Marinilabiliales bacterium]